MQQGRELGLVGDAEHHIGVAVLIGEQGIHVFNVQLALGQQSQHLGQTAGGVGDGDHQHRRFGQDEPLFSTKIKDGECWTPDNKFMYEDIIRYFADVVVRQQECIDKMTQDMKRLKESRIDAVKQYAAEFELERRQEMEEQGITPEEEEKFETVSEVILNQHRDIEDMEETTRKIETTDNRIHALRTENLLLKNELVDLKRENMEMRKLADQRERENKKDKKELEKMIKELREDVFFYRLKRKMRHISGKDEQ